MSTSKSPIIYWFRQDLRLSDLPGLQAAAATGQPILPVYVLDDNSAGNWAAGGASRWWLHHSLTALSTDISAANGQLLVCAGDTQSILAELATVTDAAGVYCSRGYEPWAATLERQLHETFEAQDIEFRRFGGNLLFEPEQIANQSGLPFKVFTPFWKACLRQPEPRQPRPKIDKGFYGDSVPALKTAQAQSLDALNLLPVNPDWAEGWESLWQPGETGAAVRLERFLETAVNQYDEGRDQPALAVTSQLSPHIHHGEVSPRQIWHAAQSSGKAVKKFLSELGWREFSYHLLHHFPDIPESAFKPQFNAFPWLGKPEHLRAWQKGQTGYPLVDAGMRELWQTGFMHNRVRMVVASFLTKHLLLPWQAGEAWFWDCLVDADLASNSCSWQWVAGSGADAAPYFRIFNPTAQGEKFDKAGEYIRRWVPELSALPDKYLHEPAAAPDQVLSEAGLVLGQDYPRPLVDHKQARQAALDAYEAIRQTG
ncbi:MAG: deoxyribodipyrimidine photo-lyase [Pseudomonadota bacterium]